MKLREINHLIPSIPSGGQFDNVSAACNEYRKFIWRLMLIWQINSKVNKRKQEKERDEGQKNRDEIEYILIR